MAHAVTASSRRIVGELRHIVERMDEGALCLLSVDARIEWRRLIRRLPSEVDLSSGYIALSDEDAAWLLIKATRFSQIVAGAYQQLG